MLDWISWLDTKSGLAAWVQAVFGIVTVVVTAALVLLQDRLARRQILENRRIEEARRIMSILLALSDCHSRISLIASNIKVNSLGFDMRSDAIRKLRTNVDMLSAIPLFEIPDWRVASELSHLPSLFDMIQLSISNEKHLKSSLALVELHLTQAMKTCQDAYQERDINSKKLRERWA